MTDLSDFEERQELADAITDHRFLELVDFSRDGYRTMLVSADSKVSASALTIRAESLGYEVSGGPDGQKLVLEAPERASKKVPWEVTG